jgi:hypothetical protein
MTQLTEQQLDERWARHRAAMKTRDEEKYDLICDICFLLGGDAMIQCTQERHEVWEFVRSLPRYRR